MNLPPKSPDKSAACCSPPPGELYIYYLQGRLPPDVCISDPAYIGNWEEDGFSFLFFSAPAPEQIRAVLKRRPRLVHIDTYHMPYDQWQGGRVRAFSCGRLRIVPPWDNGPDAEASSDEHLQILLDPGVVFGNGTHPTTRHCLEALQAAFADTDFQRALDLGTGSGVLALAAARLGCPATLAVDFNLLAAQTAARNVRLNGLQHRVAVVQGKAEDFIDLPAELLIANIHFEVMQKLITAKALQNKKIVILSGLLRGETAQIAGRLAACGIDIVKSWDHENCWHTFYGCRPQRAVP